MLMYENSITAEAAFAQLVKISSRSNVKIREIAATMVEEATARALRADDQPGGRGETLAAG